MMANPLEVLDVYNRQIAIMILKMFDKKSVGEICDILDVVIYYVNQVADIDFDDRIFKYQRHLN